MTIEDEDLIKLSGSSAARSWCAFQEQPLTGGPWQRVRSRDRPEAFNCRL